MQCDRLSLPAAAAETSSEPCWPLHAPQQALMGPPQSPVPTVVLNLLRHVVVDDVLDGWEVQALGSNVSGNQDILLPIPEGLDGFCPLLLICKGPVEKISKGRALGPTYRNNLVASEPSTAQPGLPQREGLCSLSPNKGAEGPLGPWGAVLCLYLPHTMWCSLLTLPQPFLTPSQTAARQDLLCRVPAQQEQGQAGPHHGQGLPDTLTDLFLRGWPQLPHP